VEYTSVVIIWVIVELKIYSTYIISLVYLLFVVFEKDIIRRVTMIWMELSAFHPTSQPTEWVHLTYCTWLVTCGLVVASTSGNPHLNPFNVLQETTKPLNFGQIPYQSLNKVQVPHHPLIFLKFLNIPRSYFSFLTS
jgi:hypothetical protein